MQSYLLDKQTQKEKLFAQTQRNLTNKKSNNKKILNSYERIENFVNSDRYQNIYKSTIQLCQPEHHQFRDRQKNMELDDKGILVKNFETAKERAEINEKFIKSQIQDRQLYSKNLTTEFLRQREKEKEGETLQFGSERLSEDRINKIIENNQMIDYSEKNMNKTHFPKYRDQNKNKWISTQMNFNKKAVNWEQPQFEPYDKFQSKKMEGEEFLIAREKSKEQGRFEFISMVSSQQLDNAEFNSASIRTYFQDKALKIDPNYFTYSQNQKLDTFYKKAILKTGSLDNGFPFKHSTNKRGQPLKDLRPSVEKIYKNSIKNQISQKIFTKKQLVDRKGSIHKIVEVTGSLNDEQNISNKEKILMRKSQIHIKDDKKIIERYFNQFN